MTGEIRREKILECIKNSHAPLSGTELAKRFTVSRQVIVQDIALLRVANNDILSTNRGYLLNTPNVMQRVFQVLHRKEDIVDELYTIVDLGGKVVDVFVDHKVYGKISVVLIIRSRKDVDAFMEAIHAGQAAPLMDMTSGYHYHTVEAESEMILDAIEKMLKDKDYLVEDIVTSSMPKCPVT